MGLCICRVGRRARVSAAGGRVCGSAVGGRDQCNGGREGHQCSGWCIHTPAVYLAGAPSAMPCVGQVCLCPGSAERCWAPRLAQLGGEQKSLARVAIAVLVPPGALLPGVLPSGSQRPCQPCLSCLLLAASFPLIFLRPAALAAATPPPRLPCWQGARVAVPQTNPDLAQTRPLGGLFLSESWEHSAPCSACRADRSSLHRPRAPYVCIGGSVCARVLGQGCARPALGSAHGAGGSGGSSDAG